MHTEVLIEEDVRLDSIANKVSRLIVHNDDFNTFDWVIETLIVVCRHTPEQAEQCTHIVHYNGKCQVKHGHRNIMERLCLALIQRGLTASIEE